MNLIIKTREFFAGVMAELKKSSWPTRKELIDSTIVVIAVLIVLGIFVAMADTIFVKFMAMLLRSA